MSVFEEEEIKRQPSYLIILLESYWNSQYRKIDGKVQGTIVMDNYGVASPWENFFFNLMQLVSNLDRGFMPL